MHFALDGMPTFAAPYEMLNDPEMQSTIGLFSTPEELQQQWEDCRRGIVPADPAIAMQFPSVHDPDLAPAGKQAISAFSLWFPVEEQRHELRRHEGRDGPAGDREDHPARTELRDADHPAHHLHAAHMGTMFGAPGGDYCHGLIHPDQMGPNRPGRRAMSTSPFRSTGCTWAARDAMAAQASRSSRATTRRSGPWLGRDPRRYCV